jgi:redox-sensitive bicupin YhaK (pirin superfamily)
MIIVRPAGERGHAVFDWLDSHHTFSFGHYYDPQHMGFGPLRVINEDRVAAGGGFPPHGHANMEIITCVLDGALQHKDSLGNGSVMRPGDVQRMTAGSGIEHSEFNASKDEPVHFLQIWIQPDRVNVQPGYEQKVIPLAEREGRLRVLVSPDGRDGSLRMQQDALLMAAVLEDGQTVEHTVAAGRRAWLQVASGSVDVNGTALKSGDGAAVVAEDRIVLSGRDKAHVLVFDLP